MESVYLTRSIGRYYDRSRLARELNCRLGMTDSAALFVPIIPRLYENLYSSSNEEPVRHNKDDVFREAAQ